MKDDTAICFRRLRHDYCLVKRTGYGKERADDFIADINQSLIVVNHEITDEIFSEAGRLKASYKISLADSLALAQAIVSGGVLLTCDHHEFDVIEGKENIKFVWVR